MISHMARTTLIIPEESLVELKRLAAQRRQTLSSLVDQFLREGLQRASASPGRKRLTRLPAFDMGLPAVNLADRDQLQGVLGGR
jgi:hypothetical protein